MGGRACPVCGQPMTRFAGGWKCMNVKAHARALRDANKSGGPRNPRGVNQTAPRKPRARAGLVRTICPSCENGKRRNPRKCKLCGRRGWIWSIK